MWYSSKTARMGNCRFEVTTDERPGTTYFAPTAVEAWEIVWRLTDQGIALDGIAVADCLAEA